MTDLREDVRAAVAESLPKFFRRNEVEVYERSFATRHEQGKGRVDARVLENLAWWLTSAVPSGVYRVACGANQHGIACACSGNCLRWLPVPGALCTCPHPYGGKGGERFKHHLSRCPFSETSMKAAGRG